MKLLTSLLLAAAPLLAAADAPPGDAPPGDAPPGADTYFSRNQILRAELSPSGRFVAVTTSYGSPRVDLAVFALKPELRAARLVHEQWDDVADFQWSGDDKILFTLGDMDTARGSREAKAPGLFAVDLAGHRRQLIARRFMADEIRLMGNIKTLNPNYRLLWVPAQHPGGDASEVVIGQALTFSDKRVTSVRPQWLNVRDGTTHEMKLGVNPPDALSWWFDSKGEPRLAVTVTGPSPAYYWRAPGQDEWRPLFEEGEDRTFLPVGFDDAGQLYAAKRDGPRRERALWRVDMQTLALDKEPLLRAPGFDVNASMIRGEPGQPVLGVRYEADLVTTQWFDPAMQAFQREVDARFPGHVNSISCRRCGQPDMVALVRSFADRDPGSFWVFDATSKAWQLIGRRKDSLDAAHMARVTMDRIKARDGEDLPVWLTLPVGWVRGGPPAPAVVMVHGGPWVREGSWSWHPLEQFLASRGYLIISPEFRGSDGYGAQHLNAGNKQWGRSMQDDVADALLWAQGKGLASKDACIAGGSYGGYSTLMGLVRDPQLYRCGAAWAAVADLSLFLQGDWTTSDDIPHLARSGVYRRRVGNPLADAEMLAAVSPVQQAARIKAPLLLVYGQEDVRVPMDHGQRLRKAMIAAGNPPEWKVFKDDVHGFTSIENQVEFAQTLEAFLARHLKPAGSASPAAQ
ncbi:MAG: S9 family peptidase [Paucibacter sp.]|nr:S9 family peptidase [Roseateles sp.]